MLFSDRPLSTGIDVLGTRAMKTEVCRAPTEHVKASRRYPSSSSFSWSSSRLGQAFLKLQAARKALALWPVRRCIGHNQLQRQIHLALWHHPRAWRSRSTTPLVHLQVVEMLLFLAPQR